MQNKRVYLEKKNVEAMVLPHACHVSMSMTDNKIC